MSDGVSLRLKREAFVDFSRPLTFKFDGHNYTGFEGDTLASALLANNVRIVGRSFKYHRPRGVLTSGNDEPNALVTVKRARTSDPNTRATTIELYDGLEATSQNRWPSLGFDLLSVNQLAAPILSAGFYYKTFMWPAKWWEKLYEPLIRRAAGLGRLADAPDPDSYDLAHGYCDLLVVGAGPAGLAAALAAARSRARVILADDDWQLGGRLLAERHSIDQASCKEWLEQTIAELVSLKNVTILKRTSVFGLYDGEWAAVERLTDHLASVPRGMPRQRLWKLIAKQSLLATGASERTIAFGGNDRPGIVTASAASTYINRFSVCPGRKVAIFMSSASGWSTVGDLLEAGIDISAIICAGPFPACEQERSAQGRGIPIFRDANVTDAYGAPIKEVVVRTGDGRVTTIAVDALAVAGGWNPAMGLACNTGCKPVWSDVLNCFVLRNAPKGVALIGAAAAHFTLGEGLADGVRAGLLAVEAVGIRPIPMPTPVTHSENYLVHRLSHIPHAKSKAFVDFQNDVTVDDIKLAAVEGYTSVEHLKRYTTLGMGTDQGKSSQVNGHAVLADFTARTMKEVGTIMSRPPFIPVSIGALAGHHRGANFRPTRLTPSHDWAAEHGATFVDAAAWKRARWFSLPKERHWLETVSREVSLVRASVGICDVSTLGKIDVHGADAAKLLDRLYVNTMSTLAVGKVRYGLMLREDGIAFDDGTVTRLGEDHFFITTTTANASRVMQHIDFCRQVIWPEFDVQTVSVTDHWAQYAIAGPNARRLIQKVMPDMDLSNEGFPYMAATNAKWGAVPMRIYRVSFSGELAYEIGVPANHGDALIRALMKAGSEFEVIPYGTEALSVMRIEKGHVAGNELNGQTTARDLGLDKMMSTKKDFIGRALARREGLRAPDRPLLVGFRPVDRSATLDGGAHLFSAGARYVPANDEGYITSVAFSPGLAHWIGLGFLRGGPSRNGAVVHAYDPVRQKNTLVEVCAPQFIDPEGARLRV